MQAENEAPSTSMVHELCCAKYIALMSQGITRRITALFLVVLFLLGLPYAGLFFLAEVPPAFFEFPPRALYIAHEPFSWIAFSIYLFLILILFVLGLKIAIPRLRSLRIPNAGPFPICGWIGVGLMLASWGIAWSRLEVFAPLQSHTFFPLWLGYIFLANAAAEARSGYSSLRAYGWSYVLLFPASAMFWWTFEYLNRFVQNWSYQASLTLSETEYFLWATLSFSTVLPAVLATKEWIQSFFVDNEFTSTSAIQSYCGSITHAVMVVCASLLLLCLGIFPNALFPAVWVAPLLLIYSFDSLLIKNGFCFKASQDQGIELLVWAVAALFSGVFWEMWNFWSFPKWIYHVPYVNAFYVFEMPVLGFAGYLPFGIFCGAIISLFGFRAKVRSL